MIWCLGMYASGSTWMFNAVRQTGAAAAPAYPLVGTYAESLDVLTALAPHALHVVKTHDLPAAETKFLAQRASQIVITVRDPRDAVVSLMQHMRHNFSQALEKIEKSAAYCAHFAADPRARLFNYDAGFTESIETFDTLAALFNSPLTPAARAALFANTRRGAIEAQIALIPTLPTAQTDARSGDVVDTDTHWHRHHAGRTGEIGRWQRMLPANAAAVIAQRMAGFMRQFGYR